MKALNKAFVIYHSNLSKESAEAIGNIYSEKDDCDWKGRWHAFQKNYLPFVNHYIDIFFKSAKLFHPGCKCVVLSDLLTPFDLSEDIEIHRFAVDPEKPAYNRLLAQREYLKNSGNSFDKLFLDYDMIINQPLEKIWGFDFDIALTCDSRRKRINGSFILIRSNSLEKGVSFFDAVERLFFSYHSYFEAWGGIEASMNDFFTKNQQEIKPSKVFEIEGIKTLVLPSETYNYPIASLESLFLEYLPKKVILHFRGNRKTAMQEYWKTFLSSQIKNFPS